MDGSLTFMPTAYFQFNVLPGTGGAVGEIVMQRPQALNAHDKTMCIALSTQLQAWANDAAIKAVVIRSGTERAFCAGGDIRAVYELGRQGQTAEALTFFYHEYQLVQQIVNYPKPYIALIDGIAMGGGLGISVHGSHCVVTEHALMAMPETAIGFFPDVGASYFFNRSPHEIGTYLALTGARIKAADAVYVGLAKAMLSSSHISAFITALRTQQFSGDANACVDQILHDIGIAPDIAPLLQHQTQIAEYFATDQVEEIIAKLSADDSDWAKNTWYMLTRRSPTSLKVTLQQLRQMRQADLQTCLQLDYILAQRFLQNHDFYEGVRAVVVDKDQHAHWQPAQLSEVTPTVVASYFA